MVSIRRTNVQRPFSFNSYAPMHTLVTYSWISSDNWALDQVLAWSCPFMTDFSSLKLWMEIFNPITWISSSIELWEQTHYVLFWYHSFWALVIYHLNESFRDCFPIWCILAQVTKTWWHCIVVSPCTIPCASRLHHNISINTKVHLSLEQECSYPIPLECILDNLVTSTCFHYSLLEVYTFESWIVWV
jgi:hypothetical protein